MSTACFEACLVVVHYKPRSQQEEEKTDELEVVSDSKKKKSKKAKVEEDDVVVKKKKEKAADPNAVINFRISAPLREKLKSKGIESLFPIQAMTFNTVLDGADLVGRARTGQGKTLAFVLPILESLINGSAKTSRKTGYGRAPSVTTRKLCFTDQTSCDHRTIAAKK